MKYIGKNGRKYMSASALAVGDSLHKITRQRRNWNKFNRALNTGEGIMGIVQLVLGAFLISTNIVGPGILGLILIVGGVISITDFKNYQQPRDSLFDYIESQQRHGLAPLMDASTEEINEWIEGRQEQRRQQYSGL